MYNEDRLISASYSITSFACDETLINFDMYFVRGCGWKS